MILGVGAAVRAQQNWRKVPQVLFRNFFGYCRAGSMPNLYVCEAFCGGQGRHHVRTGSGTDGGDGVPIPPASDA